MTPHTGTDPQLKPPPSDDHLRLSEGHHVTFRPLAVADGALYLALDARLSDEDRRLRFFSPAHLSAPQIRRFTQFDRERASAIVAIDDGDDSIAGVARLHRLEDGSGEFAVLVRPDLKRKGLGAALMRRIIADAERIGVGRIEGLILRENAGMLRFARGLGFVLNPHPDDPTLMTARLDA